MTETHNPPRTKVMGIRDGKAERGKAERGKAQFGGSFGAGQSGGGAYATPHGTEADLEHKAGQDHGDQSLQGYHGGGQAGAENHGGDDHHAAARGRPDDDSGATYRDHPSQQDDAPAKP